VVGDDPPLITDLLATVSANRISMRLVRMILATTISHRSTVQLPSAVAMSNWNASSFVDPMA
jgi:hypothetical protein